MRIASVETELYRIPRAPGLSSASASIEATSMLVGPACEPRTGWRGWGGRTATARRGPA